MVIILRLIILYIFNNQCYITGWISCMTTADNFLICFIKIEKSVCVCVCVCVRNKHNFMLFLPLNSPSAFYICVKEILFRYVHVMKPQLQQSLLNPLSFFTAQPFMQQKVWYFIVITAPICKNYFVVKKL
jgi:hypothetical protein